MKNSAREHLEKATRFANRAAGDPESIYWYVRANHHLLMAVVELISDESFG